VVPARPICHLNTTKLNYNGKRIYDKCQAAWVDYHRHDIGSASDNHDYYNSRRVDRSMLSKVRTMWRTGLERTYMLRFRKHLQVLQPVVLAVFVSFDAHRVFNA
jgi:hypothetical protein